MGTIQHAIDKAELQLQKAITDRHLFKNRARCFGFFYVDTFDRVVNDGYSRDYAAMVAEYFTELFDKHFETDFAR